MALLDFMEKEKEYHIYWKRVIVDNFGRLVCAICGYIIGRSLVG